MDDFQNPAIESASTNPDFIRQRRIHSKPHPGKCWNGKQLRRAQDQIEVLCVTFVSVPLFLFFFTQTWFQMWFILITPNCQHHTCTCIHSSCHPPTERTADLGFRYFPIGKTSQVRPIGPVSNTPTGFGPHPYMCARVYLAVSWVLRWSQSRTSRSIAQGMYR